MMEKTKSPKASALEGTLEQSMCLSATYESGLEIRMIYLSEMRAFLKFAMITERQSSPLIEILYQYIELREEERNGWNGKAQLNGMVHDYEKVSSAIDYLKGRDILTLESLDEHLSELETKAKNYRNSLKYNERRYKTIENIKERYYEQHKEEIDAYRNAVRFLKADHGSLEVKKNAFDEEIKKRKASDQKNQEGLEFLKTDLQELRQVRYFVDKVLVNEAEKQKAKSIHERLEEEKQKIQQKEKGKICKFKE